MAELEVKTESIGYPMPGDVLDERYRLDEIINAGGMGVIMRARQLTMDRDVAVKLLLPDRSSRETTRTRFMREIHLAKQLTHPNTIRLYDYGKHGEFLYLVMELLSGRDLKAVLKQEGPLHVARAVDILIQAADAVSEAHDRNIVHRDLKPGNLFIQRLGSNRDFVKVLDFGIAKSLESGKYDVTSTGEVSGTVAYLSPEMVRGKRPDKRADVYALGVLFMEMITCRKIFEGVTVAETLMNQMQKPPQVPPSLVNTPLAQVIERALTKNPDDRYQDAAELLDALNGVVRVVSPTLRLTENEIANTYGARLGDEAVSESQNAIDAVEEAKPTSRATRIGYAMALEEGETVQVNTDEELGGYVADPEADESNSRLGLWVGLVAAIVIGIGVTSALMTPRPAVVPEPAEPAEPVAGAAAAPSTAPDLAAQELEAKPDLGQPVGDLELPLLPARSVVQTALDLATGVAELDAEELADAADERKSRRPKRPPPKKPTEKPARDTVDTDLDVFGAAKPVPKPEPPSESPAELRAAANKAFLAGDYAGCVTKCKKALASGETSCHSLLANAYRQMGNTKAACRHYKAAGIAHKSCITLQSR